MVGPARNLLSNHSNRVTTGHAARRQSDHPLTTREHKQAQEVGMALSEQLTKLSDELTKLAARAQEADT